MTARIFVDSRKARGHRPRLQPLNDEFCNTLDSGGQAIASYNFLQSPLTATNLSLYTPEMIVRILEAGDEPALEAFLVTHRDTAMFLRSNLRRSGLPYRAEPFHAHYVGAFREKALAGVLAHYWNGMVLVQAHDCIEELARACIAWSSRQVTGFAGPTEQVHRARSALGLSSAPARIESDEWLYHLELTNLIIPAPLSNQTVVCRAPRPEERGLLCEWRTAYDIESLGGTDSLQTRQHAADVLDNQIADGNVWVALDNGKPVSLSAFNAALPDIVQLGGIYTPPEFRGHGYAKAAVAASLLAARERGATRAVLFTSNPSAARSYEAVGFQRSGSYGLVLLKT